MWEILSLTPDYCNFPDLILPKIYSYGYVSKREGNYHTFTQSISDNELSVVVHLCADGHLDRDGYSASQAVFFCHIPMHGVVSALAVVVLYHRQMENIKLTDKDDVRCVLP